MSLHVSVQVGKLLWFCTQAALTEHPVIVRSFVMSLLVHFSPSLLKLLS